MGVLATGSPTGTNLSLNPLYVRTVAKHLLWPKLWSCRELVKLCTYACCTYTTQALPDPATIKLSMKWDSFGFFFWKVHIGKRKKSITFPELSILLSHLTYKTKPLNYSGWINQNTWCQWCADQPEQLIQAVSKLVCPQGPPLFLIIVPNQGTLNRLPR